MTHPRTTIRTSVMAILNAAKPAGWTIRKGRGRPVAAAQCPCVVLAIPSEQAQRGAQRKRRDPVLTVTAYIASAENGDDAADAAAEWIEAALDADPSLGGAVSDSVHVNSEIQPHTGGELPVWELTLTYQLRVS